MVGADASSLLVIPVGAHSPLARFTIDQAVARSIRVVDYAEILLTVEYCDIYGLVFKIIANVQIRSDAGVIRTDLPSTIGSTKLLSVRFLKDPPEPEPEFTVM